jgi:precorrin-6A/cobalt-precorrin-6A reductase
MARPHLLVLGGTGEARRLVARLASIPGLRLTLSLAGRTRDPVSPHCEVRTGGFGGAEGLVRWLRDEKVAILADATHPFARTISVSARSAAAATGVPLVSLGRPPWEAGRGDRWIRVADMAAAATALGDAPRRVFLAVGRQEVAAFRAAPQHHYLVRSIEPVPVADLPPRAATILARGPFAEVDERRLLGAHRIEVVVAKNSGGEATRGKIAAARALRLPVVMLDRAHDPEAATLEEAEERIRHLLASGADRGV